MNVKSSPSLLSVLPFLAGLAGLAWLLQTQDYDALRDGFAAVGPWFAVGCAAHFTGLFLDAITLRECSNAPQAPLSLFVRASVTGHAINEATPLGKLGEVTKFSILKERLRSEDAVAALVVQNIFMFAANCLLFMALPLALQWAFPLSSQAGWALGICAGLFFLAFLVALALLHWGIGMWPFSLLQGLGISEKRVQRWRNAWAAVEKAWQERQNNSQPMTAAWLTAVASRMANVAEAALYLHLLGCPVPLAGAFLSLAGYQLVFWLTSFIPLQAGTAEGGSYLAFEFFGLNPAHGLLVELIRKLRRLVFITLGVLLLARSKWKRS